MTMDVIVPGIMTQRLPIEIKKLRGTLRVSRERKYAERDAAEREGNWRFVRSVVMFFLGEAKSAECDEVIWWGLENDVNQLATRLWRAHEKDFREEFRRRYPGRPEPEFWKKYERAASEDVCIND
jgi:hypothetical protein